MIVIVFGLPGSGKSYFASRLSEALGAKYISSDRLRRALFPVREYSLEEKKAVYDKMANLSKAAILQKEDVVLDGTFYRKDIRNSLWKELKGYGTLHIIEVIASEPIVQQRLLRPREYSEADYGVYLKVKSQWQPFRAPHLTLQSTNENIKEMLKHALTHIKRQK